MCSDTSMIVQFVYCTVHGKLIVRESDLASIIHNLSHPILYSAPLLLDLLLKHLIDNLYIVAVQNLLTNKILDEANYVILKCKGDEMPIG